MWNLRLSNTPFNPSIVYEGHPTLFTIKLYHGGEFTNFGDRKYIDGKVNYVDMVDIYEFSIHDLDAIMRGLRYGVPPFIYYHFLVPNGDFQFGFRPLGNDSDLLNLAQYVADHKLIRVYTEHGECTLLTYYMNLNPVRKVTLALLDEVGTAPVLEQVVEIPSNIAALPVSNEANAIVPISPEYNRTRFWNQEKVLSSCSKRLIMEEFDIGLYQQILEADSFVHVGTSGTEQVGTSAKEQVEKEEVVIEEIVEEDQVVNEEVVVEDQGVNEEVVVEDPVNEQVDYVTEAQLDEFNLQDYMDFPEFEDEWNAGTGGGDNVELEGGASDQHSETDDDDSEDSDYWVDEENIIRDDDVLRVICKGVVAGSTSGDVTKGVRKSQRNRKEVCGPTTTGNNKSNNKDKGKDKSVYEKDSSCPWVIQASRSTTEDNWAKSEARKHVVGDYTKQYEVLRDYILELQSTNPDTTVKMDLVSGPNLDNVTSRCFKRIYICLGAMKKGFRAVGMEERSQRQKQQLHGSSASGSNLTRRFIRIRCGKCKNFGHNARTCKGGVAGSQGGGSQGGASQGV
ncbi:hypothetical protein LXL04_037271 [Taraxacum kok-saghyz]